MIHEKSGVRSQESDEVTAAPFPVTEAAASRVALPSFSDGEKVPPSEEKEGRPERGEPGVRPATPSCSWSDVPEVAVPLNDEPLSLEQTLACGQAFRWRRVAEGVWEGIADGRVWRLRLADRALLMKAVPTASEECARSFLSSYFALDLPVRAIAQAVAAAHPAAADAASRFQGLRILRQDPLETILTFTIATATNVPRVTRSIAALCERFGEPIATVDGVAYHDFPTVEAILAAPVDELFGPCNLAYRARSIKAVAKSIRSQFADWPEALTRLSYAEAHQALVELPFLGPKVSDCICLFGLGHADAVPVDVHVWAIAHELFGEDIPTRTLTRKTYQQIGDRFRALFSPWAGWAQQYLFCARRAVPINQRFRPGKQPFDG